MRKLIMVLTFVVSFLIVSWLIVDTSKAESEYNLLPGDLIEIENNYFVYGGMINDTLVFTQVNKERMYIALGTIYVKNGERIAVNGKDRSIYTVKVVYQNNKFYMVLHKEN